MTQEKLTTRDIAGTREPVHEDVRRDVREPQDRLEPVDAGAAPMFEEQEAVGYRTRWDAIQTGFVDEPRRAVEEADALVAQVMKRLAEGFADERTALERQWDRGDQISTEDLRLALRRYRSFFQRLLSV
jgi:hypothetical protein